VHVVDARHSAWLFTVLNLLHVLGAAFVVGIIGTSVCANGQRGLT
jgi:hypothetical protein